MLWQRNVHDDYAPDNQTRQIMATSLQIVAQYTQDQFYQNYRSNTDFFELKDFVFHCGAAIAGAYKQEYDAHRLELRQDGREEIVSFSHDWLLEQVVPVVRKKQETFAVLTQMPMSFPFDMQDTGIQEVFSQVPFGVDLERSNITEIWQQKHYPGTNRIFWWVDQNKIRFFNKGICNVEMIRVLYVPTIADNMQVPDGIVEIAVINTVAKMKEIAKGIVIKKSLDGNDNKILQTEIDTSVLKG